MKVDSFVLITELLNTGLFSVFSHVLVIDEYSFLSGLAQLLFFP